jgi:hypothetical protein
MAFHAIREDGRTYWQVIYETIEHKPVDEVIPHRELFATLGLDTPTPAYYMAVNRAARELRDRKRRSLRAIRGDGYQVVAGKAQIDQAREHQKRGRKNMAKTVQIAKTVDQSILTSQEAADLKVASLAWNAVLTALTQQAEKLGRHEEQIRVLQETTVKRTDPHLTPAEKEFIRKLMDEREG